MTDTSTPFANPVLDRIAQGNDRGHHHHHEQAARHHERAAEHHRQAYEAHERGDTDAASAHAFHAYSHGAHAEHHANESLKGYAVVDADTGYSGRTGAGAGDAKAGTYGLGEPVGERRTEEVRTERVVASQAAEPRTGESVIPLPGEATAAPITNPDAAYTPNIGGAPGQRS